MPATYDPAAHPLLSTAAAALDPEALEAHAITAERVLGLHGTALTGAEAEDAATASVRQINLQVRMDGAGGSDVVSASKGSQSYTYAQVNGRRVVVDKLALMMAEQLVGRRGSTPAGVTELESTW